MYLASNPSFSFLILSHSFGEKFSPKLWDKSRMESLGSRVVCTRLPDHKCLALLTTPLQTHLAHLQASNWEICYNCVVPVSSGLPVCNESWEELWATVSHCLNYLIVLLPSSFTCTSSVCWIPCQYHDDSTVEHSNIHRVQQTVLSLYADIVTLVHVSMHASTGPNI